MDTLFVPGKSLICTFKLFLISMLCDSGHD